MRIWYTQMAMASHIANRGSTKHTHVHRSREIMPEFDDQKNSSAKNNNTPLEFIVYVRMSCASHSPFVPFTSRRIRSNMGIEREYFRNVSRILHASIAYQSRMMQKITKHNVQLNFLNSVGMVIAVFSAQYLFAKMMKSYWCNLIVCCAIEKC